MRKYASRIGRLAVLATVALALLVTRADAVDQTVGVFVNEPGAYDGYTLIAPLLSSTNYLIDNDGNYIHSWDVGTGTTSYLLPDGSVLHPANGPRNPKFNPPGGATGRVVRVAWDGTLLWDFAYSDTDNVLHHDIEMLPNGNVLMIAWETKTFAEAVAAGRDPALLPDGEIWPLHIIEVEPTGLTTGDIVWEWHLWDHLVQDFDASKANYDVVGDHPELVDVNFGTLNPQTVADWDHTNAIDYNPQFDQLMVSIRQLNEFWVIDHSTTTAQAAGHTGGNSSSGGDLLYRWGNPASYRAGDASDQQLFLQHDSHWIEPGLPGAGNILVFNNGANRPAPQYSSVEEITPPVDMSGNYSLTPGQAYGPAAPTWTYSAPNPTDFYSAVVSGAGRQPNGDTLIDSGVFGNVFEVTPAGEIVWDYINPVAPQGPLVQGDPIPAFANALFRAYRYAPGYSAFDGRDLTPGPPLENDGDMDGLSDLAETDVVGSIRRSPTRTATAARTALRRRTPLPSAAAVTLRSSGTSSTYGPTRAANRPPGSATRLLTSTIC